MIRDELETKELFQGPTIGIRAKKIKERVKDGNDQFMAFCIKS